ncbi:MAG: cation diffusion facilitator family transporter [bacterium]|nr:cation diffusion facilitator family transporter [bacterium]
MIKKIFIKNYKEVNNKEVRKSYGKVAGIFGIISNLTLAIIKLVIGLFSNSVSIIADSINNISDMVTSILTIIGFNLSSKHPTKEHPYGFARYEYVSGLVISIFMIFMGVLFAKESIIKIIHPKTLVINLYTYIILLIAIFIKSYQMIVYFDFSKSINSSTLKANAIDSKNDIISTTSILISIVIMDIFGINIDGIVGFIVSIFIIINSFKVIKEVLNPIIGIVPTMEYINMVKNKLLSYKYVIGIHDLVIHNYGENNNFITVHVEINSKMDMIVAHDLMDTIERDFKGELGINLTIHMDPIVIGNKKIDNMKQMVTNLLLKYNSNYKIHDFRIVEGRSHINILFDIVVPYEIDYDLEEIKRYLDLKINKKRKKYFFIIEVDRPLY